MTEFEGKISIERVSEYDREDRLVLDAEPYIMVRVRSLLTNSRNEHRGAYTHSSMSFAVTLSNCRDLQWLMSRYIFDVSESDLRTINEKSQEYEDNIKAVKNMADDDEYKPEHGGHKLHGTLKPHQVQFNNMFKKMKRMLLADVMGLGKTVEGISILAEPNSYPALICVPPTLCTQWQKELKRFLPDATTHIITGFKNYDLPDSNIYITSYNRLSRWQDTLIPMGFQKVIFDEVHDLRHTGTEKYSAAKAISSKAECVLGLSGTPIINLGQEIFNVAYIINPEVLGDRDDFLKEWCSYGGHVNEPASLNKFLKNQGFMLRRTPEQTGLNFGSSSKHIITIDSDLKTLRESENIMKTLALSVLSGNVGEDSMSAKELDWKLRHATGVSKAKAVSEFVKNLLEQEDKVVLAGWHRDVYDIWMKELKSYNPVMFTGSETVAQKDKSVKEFIEGDSRVFIISLRSGAGLDGLQHACNHVVIGELDWSPHITDQLIARLDREGQARHVQAFFLTISDGSDPFMINLTADKRSQHDGLVEGKYSEDVLEDVGSRTERVRDMARAFLESIGAEIPEPVEETGALGQVASLIRTLRLPNNTEAEMQEALYASLQKLPDDLKVHREYKIGKRSRLDFMIETETDKIAIECKIDSTKKAEVYRQVRRYVEEGVNSVILVAPWMGVNSFKVDGTPVIIIDTSINNL